MLEIEFLEDFATKAKGEVWLCQSYLAMRLIRRGIAKKAVQKRVRRTKAQIEADELD